MGIFLVYLVGGLGSWVLDRSVSLSLLVGQGSAILAGILGMALSLIVLLNGTTDAIHFSSTIFLLEVKLTLDPLAAFFILLVSLISIAVSTYSFGYMRTYANHYSIGLFGLLYNGFLCSLVAVISASNGFLFLLLWELMSLFSFLLVNYEHDHSETRQAAFTYLLMTHIGTAFIFVAFLLGYFAVGTFDWEAMKNIRGSLSDGLKGIIFLCALIGFGTKGGIVPLHIWLPVAHPAAPSNVSALMSGVMIKIAVYGIIRLGIDILGLNSWGWGFTILLMASATSVLGIFYAIDEKDLKRLLAFSSIENIGIILIGVGTAIIFSSFGLKPLSALALVASLYHALNHAVFKGLLFLGAGSVASVMKTRNMEMMGGLIHRLPYTAFIFLIGAISISALPPFNGFVSEWLTFQSLLLTSNVPKSIVKMMLPIAGAVLALTAALAAACFVKAFGITFLGIPRSQEAQNAREVPLSMLLGTGFLSILCLLLAVFSGFVITLLGRVVFFVTGVNVTENLLRAGGWVVIPVYEGFSSLSVGWLISGVTLATLAAVGLAILFGGRARRRVLVKETWACGIPLIEARMEYTATGYLSSIRRIFSHLYRPRQEISVFSPDDQLYVPAKMSYYAEIEHVVEKYLYGPILALFIRAGSGAKILQSGSIHAYLAYLFMTLVVGLIVLSMTL